MMKIKLDLKKILNKWLRKGKEDAECITPHIEDGTKEKEIVERITLHVVDELTGRTKTFDIPNCYTCENLIRHAKNYGLIVNDPHCWLRYSIRELKAYRYYTKIKDTCLHNGDTVHIEFEDAALLRKSGAADRFLAEYEVVVQWKLTRNVIDNQKYSDQCYVDTIKCFGYDTKSSIAHRLERKHAERRVSMNFEISESCWPQYCVGATGEQEKVKYLCQLNNSNEVVLFAEAGRGIATLYGCPVAKSFRETDSAHNCCVEVIAYE